MLGVAISAAVRCKYCSFFHTEMARLYGATDADLEDAVHYTKSPPGWGTSINGLQINCDQFEVRQVHDYVRGKQPESKECVSCGDWTRKEEEATAV